MASIGKRAYNYVKPRLLQMNNGEKMKHIFTNEEFSNRLTKLRKLMSQKDVGACVFTSYHNINYFSGLMYCSMGRNYGLVVTHDKCTTISAYVDGGQPWRRAFGDNIIYTDWHQDNFFHAVKALAENSGGKIGLEMDVLSVDNLAKIKHAIPGCFTTDIGEAAMNMRMIKSPEEIEVIRKGAEIANTGGYAITEALKDGIPEYELVLLATRSMVQGVARAFPSSDLMDTWCWVQSGINTDGAHNPATTKPIRPGDIIILNCFPMMQGYFAALERTLFLNHASDENLQIWKVNCDVHKRGLEIVQPGNRCCDVVEELNEIYKKHDLLEYRTIGYGHSFGTICHYYGREKALELRDDITTELQPGMVLSMEPMLVIPEGMPGAGGYREHDILVVTENGNENLTKFPLGPEEMIIKN